MKVGAVCLEKVWQPELSKLPCCVVEPKLKAHFLPPGGDHCARSGPPCAE